jgi:hypothetical protein
MQEWNVHRAQSLWKPNHWIILTVVVPSKRPKSWSGSVTVTDLLLNIAAPACTLFWGCLLLSICHFSHCLSSQLNRIWSLNTFSAHFDDSWLLPPWTSTRWWLTLTAETCLACRQELQQGPPLWTAFPVESPCLTNSRHLTWSSVCCQLTQHYQQTLLYSPTSDQSSPRSN